MPHDQYPDNLDAGGRAFLDRVPLVLSTPAAQERLDPSRRACRAGRRPVRARWFDRK
jgi:hypothetical protein